VTYKNTVNQGDLMQALKDFHRNVFNCLEHGKVNHQRVLWLTLLALPLLPVKFVLKLDVLFTISTHYRHSDCEHFSEL